MNEIIVNEMNEFWTGFKMNEMKGTKGGAKGGGVGVDMNRKNKQKNIWNSQKMILYYF